MKKLIIFKMLACVTMLLLFSVTGVKAQSVTFSDISDGDSDNSLGFDVSSTVAVDNTLNIGIGEFTADGAQGDYSALDTLSFKVTAPAGWVIDKVTYSEGGTAETTNGVAVATGSITAGGVPKNFATIVIGTDSATSWTTSGWVDVVDAAEIEVSIVNSLFASTFGGLDDVATISKDLASVEVSLVPVPAAVWLLFSGLICFIGLRRKV
jgi:hypothetical protein